jgi:hypothetical protein
MPVWTIAAAIRECACRLFKVSRTAIVSARWIERARCQNLDEVTVVL